MRVGQGFLGVDPLAGKYQPLSPFVYVADNPINAVDPDGKLIIFINGLRLWQRSKDQYGSLFSFTGAMPGIYSYENGGALRDYWSIESNAFGRSSDIACGFRDCFQDDNMWFASGSSDWRSTAAERFDEGRSKAEMFHGMVLSGEVKLGEDETIKIISHSQGGAHAAGYAQRLLEYMDGDGNQLYDVELIVYITPHQPTDIEHPTGVYGEQYSHPNDWVSSNSPWWLPNGGTSFGRIPEVDFFDGRDILPGEENYNSKTRGGHNVTDNDFILGGTPASDEN